MTPEQADEARRACRDVLIDYLTAVDHHQATTALPCFTDDAEIVARGRRLHGRTEIGRFLAEREADTERRTAHLVVNDVLEQADADRVTLRARVVLLLHHPDRGYHVDQIVETTQTFTLSPTGWRIAQRDETPLHQNP